VEWSAVTWRSASPSQQEPEHWWYGGEAVQPVFSWTLPQALPEASSGVSPSHRRAVVDIDKERYTGEAGWTVLTWHLQRYGLGRRLGVINGRSLLRRDGVDLRGIASIDGALTGRVQARHRGHRQLQAADAATCRR
jgi:hypothetical protein